MAAKQPANPTFQLAEKLLWHANGFGLPEARAILALLSGKSLDYSDLYFQSSTSEGFALEDGIVKEGNFSVTEGVGVRAVSGAKTGFAYAEEINFPAIREAALAARNIVTAAHGGRIKIGHPILAHNLYKNINPLQTLPDAKKVALLRHVDAEARRLDRRITEVNVSLASSYNIILIVASDGTLAADVRPLTRLNVNVIAGHKKRRESGSAGGGWRGGYEYFLDDDRALQYAREAVRCALLNLEAVAPPAGTMPVILGPGWPGVLLHEAVGHGLEGDFNRKGLSAFTGKIGKRVASKNCTVVDQGDLPGSLRGSLNIDDEGTPTGRTVLIENGILRGFMHDKLNAKLMNTTSTGNGRRESYAALPLPRMTNTYMLPGKYPAEEIIASVKNGLYAVNFSGGQVDITSGKFVFSASEAYLIKNGKITKPVKGATLIGNGPEALKRVSLVGNDLSFDPGVGTCGKDGQSVPVGVGQPTLRIDELVVGGTATK